MVLRKAEQNNPIIKQVIDCKIFDRNSEIDQTVRLLFSHNQSPHHESVSICERSIRSKVLDGGNRPQPCTLITTNN